MTDTYDRTTDLRQQPGVCPECGHGNRLNGRIVHAFNCTERNGTGQRSAQQPASAAGVEGWFLPASSINSLQRESVDAQIKRCKAAHSTNLDIRINGQNETHEADWIKHMVKVAAPKPAVHPAITHCDNCGCDWLDNGLNPVGCPYCKQNAWRAAFVAERATRYREGGMRVEQARIHAETEAAYLHARADLLRDQEEDHEQ